jgi:hypothetical protein
MWMQFGAYYYAVSGPVIVDPRPRTKNITPRDSTAIVRGWRFVLFTKAKRRNRGVLPKGMHTMGCSNHKKDEIYSRDEAWKWLYDSGGEFYVHNQSEIN